MKRFAALILVLAFGTTQALTLVDCCCGAACKSPNEVCDHARPEPMDCCTGTPADEPAPCVHLQPSHDILPSDAAPAPEALLTIALAEESFLIPPAETVTVKPAGSPPARPRHLLLSVLLI